MKDQVVADIAVAFELEEETISSLRENYLLVNILQNSSIVSRPY
jgi:hypothetical protein